MWFVRIKNIPSHYTIKLKYMNYKTQILESNGNEFQVTYTKKNGTQRTLKGHIDYGYTDHNSGKKEYVVVFDTDEQDYRVVNTETITEFKLV